MQSVLLKLTERRLINLPKLNSAQHLKVRIPIGRHWILRWQFKSDSTFSYFDKNGTLGE